VLLDRLRDVFEQEPEQSAAGGALAPVRALGGRIRLEGVGFSFEGPGGRKVLDGISLDVAPGTRVAVVGRSGSGKSTLLKCLAGLLDPTEGTIRYDGTDLRHLDHADLRRHLGIVLQDDHLFDDTIAANISFGDEDPDVAEVVRAARAAGVDEMIERLPLGYDTRVGENGMRLSGGQRQRLAVARALYRRPAVLMLDEATSALDAESERALKAALDVALAGRTSLVIAHRLSTVRDADLIVVLDEGRVVETGTHAELFARRGLYHHLASGQLAE
jgi:ATP-binding cassette subfamily B protein